MVTEWRSRSECRVCYRHLGMCTLGKVYLMCANALRTCWALTLGYNVSALQGAQGYWALGTRGMAAVQRVLVAHLTGCVRAQYQHCAGWRASWMLLRPLGNFPWSERTSMTSHQVDGTLSCCLSNGIVLINCVFSIQSISLLSFAALDYTLLYSSSWCSVTNSLSSALRGSGT